MGHSVWQTATLFKFLLPAEVKRMTTRPEAGGECSLCGPVDHVYREASSYSCLQMLSCTLFERLGILSKGQGSLDSGMPLLHSTLWLWGRFFDYPFVTFLLGVIKCLRQSSRRKGRFPLVPSLGTQSTTMGEGKGSHCMSHREQREMNPALAWLSPSHSVWDSGPQNGAAHR